ncbi:MAG: sigma-70 family RNA polymerase sigma factor [Planctomycetota bacterium]
MSNAKGDQFEEQKAGEFHTTRWSLVQAAAEESGGAAALEELCRLYWYPLYVWARRRGRVDADAADLVQSLFCDLLERGSLAGVESSRGRFRTWLSATLKHHAANLREREQAVKRGGGRALLDIADAEKRYDAEPEWHGDTPEEAFDRAFARSTLDLALARVAEHYEASGKRDLFEALRPALDREAPLAAIGEELGMTEGAVKVAAYRLRKRFRSSLEACVAETLCEAGDLENELQALFEALSSKDRDRS